MCEVKMKEYEKGYLINLKNMKTIFIHLPEFHLYKTVIHKEKVKIHLKNSGC